MTLPPLKAEKYWRTENICSKQSRRRKRGKMTQNMTDNMMKGLEFWTQNSQYD